MLIFIFIFSGCENPFFLDTEDYHYTPSKNDNVVNLLDNFSTTYSFTRDINTYCSLLSEDFLFTYYDYENGFFESWDKTIDSMTTSRLFKNFENINLEWSLPDDSLLYDTEADSIQIALFFDLELDQIKLDGRARFFLRRNKNNSLEIYRWVDEKK